MHHSSKKWETYTQTVGNISGNQRKYKQGRISHERTKGNTVKKLTGPKWIYRFRAVATKIPVGSSAETDKQIGNFTWELKMSG